MPRWRCETVGAENDMFERPARHGTSIGKEWVGEAVFGRPVTALRVRNCDLPVVGESSQRRSGDGDQLSSPPGRQSVSRLHGG